MDQRIRVLPDNLINKIAAGEVIQRPASAVKELIENSIDAGATRISVEVKGWGRNLIKVSDDGFGMCRDDAILAFERHATSKISRLEDLFNIATMGFRGEALPSIAAVSKLTLTTCPDEGGLATQIYIEGGAMRRVSQVSSPKGTYIEVRNLFYNTPVRLKYLKSNTTELAHISEAITQQALARYEIAFSLALNGHISIQAPRANSARNRILALFGFELAQDLVQVDLSKWDITIRGFLSQADQGRSRKSHQYIFVNSRPVQSRIVSKAIYDACKDHLPKGKHPVFFLSLDVGPSSVDVNVHPTKSEINFRRADLIWDAVSEAVAESLRGCGVKVAAAGSYDPGGATALRLQAHSPQERIPALDSRKDAGNLSEKNRMVLNDEHGASEDSASKVRALADHGGKPSFSKAVPAVLKIFKGDQKLQLIGQIANSYIVLEDELGLLLVDQHVAHERVLFEDLQRREPSGRPATQELMFPQRIDLAPKEALLVACHLGELRQVGFEVEEFGGRSFLLRGAPAAVASVDYTSVFKDLISELCEFGNLSAEADFMSEVLKTVACKAAIKAKQKLDPQQIRSLIDRWMKTQIPHFCPHGRPVVVRVGLDEVERWFKK